METDDRANVSAIHRAHSGGFFWTVNRSRRIQAILEMAAKLPKLVIIAGSESEAADISERLTLRGLPVVLAASIEGYQRSIGPDDWSGGALVTTAEYVADRGPISSPMTIHLRPPFSVRSYVKRLKYSISPVQLTFVTPEEEVRAGELRAALSPHLEVENQGVGLDHLLSRTTSSKPAVVDSPRRRFGFRQSSAKETDTVSAGVTP